MSEEAAKEWEVTLLLNDIARQIAAIRESFSVTARILQGVAPNFETIEKWPIYISEYGDVMCGASDCSCDMEESIIFTPYEEDEEFPKFSPKTLHYWIEVHIEQDIARKAEKLEEEEG